MSQTIINNGDSGLTVRENLNNMFTELYGAFTIPIKLEGITGNAQQAIAANTWVEQLSVITTAGSPTIRIGTTPNGTDILEDTTSATVATASIKQYFGSATTFYITMTGTGTVNIRIDILTNYF